MVPLEFAEWEEYTRVALYHKYETGFFPKPDIEHLVVKRREKANKKNKNFYHRFIRKLLRKSQPVTSSAITEEERIITLKEHVKEKVVNFQN